MKEIIGDLVKQAEQFDLIAHQCNCFCNMGSGIAPQIKAKFPEAYQKDLETTYGDIDKLGTISFTQNSKPIIINLYGQYKYTRHEIDTNYDALRSCFKEIKKNFSGLKMGFPKFIGCGLAGGDWNIVSQIIEEELQGEDVTLVEWDKSSKK